MKHSDPKEATGIRLDQWSHAAEVRRLNLQPPSSSSRSSPAPPQEQRAERRPRLLKALFPACSSRGEGENRRGFCHATTQGLRLFLASLFLLQFASVAQVSNIYSTGFELSEGFDIQYTLMGQGGWTGTDTNG